MNRVVWPTRPEVLELERRRHHDIDLLHPLHHVRRLRRCDPAPAARIEDRRVTLMAKKWYVIHTYSGYENKVKTNLLHRIQSMGMDEKIFKVEIPTETVTDLERRRSQGHVGEEGVSRLHPRADGARRRVVVRGAQHPWGDRFRRHRRASPCRSLATSSSES